MSCGSASPTQPGHTRAGGPALTLPRRWPPDRVLVSARAVGLPCGVESCPGRKRSGLSSTWAGTAVAGTTVLPIRPCVSALDPTPMTGAKREHSTHVRLGDEADAVLELMAQASVRDKAALAADLLEEALLGRAHPLKVAAMRFARLGIVGNERESK